MSARRIALGLSYDGSTSAGFQSQPHGNTIQDRLEVALAAIAGTRVAAVAAGRTDAGVHAIGQVVHFDTEASRPLGSWVRGVNAHLPSSIAVHWACEMSAGFHARFSATARSYRYVLLDTPVRPALYPAQVGWYHRRLDVAAMARAMEVLVGRHDFSSFRAAGCQARTPERTVHEAGVERRGDYLVFRIAADAFLHHMVRNIVGALVYVGAGRLAVEDLGALLAARDRTRAPPTFGPGGLYLAAVSYPPHWALPATVAAWPWADASAGDGAC